MIKIQLIVAPRRTYLTTAGLKAQDGRHWRAGRGPCLISPR